MEYNLLLKKDGYDEYPKLEQYTQNMEMEEDVVQILSLSDEITVFEFANKLFGGTEGDLVLSKSSLMFCFQKDRITFLGDLENELVYYNQIRLQQSEVAVYPGDVLLIGDVKIVLFPDKVHVIGDKADYTSQLQPDESAQLPFDSYPYYTRSPRIIKNPPKTKIEIKQPPAKSVKDKKGLISIILPPIAMLAITLGVGIMMGRGLYLLMSVGGTGMTIIISIIRFFSERKEQKEINLKREKLYQEYLLSVRKQAFQAYESEKEAYNYNYPNINEIEKTINSYSSRIYERSISDDDFLTFSIGQQVKRTSFEIKTQDAGLAIEKDELVLQAEKIAANFSTIQKEKIVDLKKAHLGLVGPKELIHEQLKLYISQLITFHSYHELQIITIYDQSYNQEFAWMKYLPHVKIQALNVRGMVQNERSRDIILNSLNQILKERQMKLEESKKESRFVPHFLFIIDEPKLVMDHSIMEYLDKQGDALGFSIIYTSYLRANLPANIGTILLLEDSKQGKLLLENKEYQNEDVTLGSVGDCNLEYIARNLSTLIHVQGMASHIPESITFFEMYKVRHPWELEIQKRWRENDSHKSLAVPLGVRAEEDYVYLNLHEKAHGPHGLVAGTTGSGKSEIVQSYILSLAVNFHPYEVGFLLIDYKGGGMAGLFKNLPHLLGTITNLDGSESMRAMASIKSELARRQRLFSQNEVNHINDYNELFKEGAVTEPIPHLFLISDEFAELKKEQPDFMKELVSAARIGRSLGVHLILATQKPSGVVDDQIWTNSKFKLALKVQNEGDSKEIIKTPDAASITQAGRAYLQVGNNEIYELFQSAWSGALYIPEKEKDITLDNRVYAVNELGQGQLINQNLMGSQEERKAKETQLDVVVSHIRDVYENQATVEVKRPWLPPLEEKVISPIMIGETVDLGEGISVPVGLIDIPEEQSQVNYQIDLSKEGNIAYFASSGYGKSVFLTTMALSLAKSYDVEDVNLYVLDFGNNTLVPLRNLPHTSEYISVDDEERFRKFRNLIEDEIKFRKKCMAQAMAQNFQVYNQVAEEKLRAIVVLIDNFDAVKEMGYDLEAYFTRVTRDGAGLGIYFIITATRVNALRAATSNNFKVKIAGFNFEPSEVTSIVGRSNYKLPEIKGRAMIKYGDNISMLQLYTMFAFDSEVVYAKELKEMVQNIRDNAQGQEAPHIPILPEEFYSHMLDQYPGQEADIYFGLEKEEVVLCGIDRMESPFLIAGDSGKGKTNAIKLILQQLDENDKKVIFDSANMHLYEYRANDGAKYIASMEEFVSYMDELEQEVIRREQEFEENLKKHSNLNPRDIMRSMEPYYIFIDDIDSFYALKTTATKEIAQMFQRACNVGMTLIASGNVSKMKGIDEMTRYIKNSQNGLLVSPQGYNNIFQIQMHEDKIGFMDGLLIRNGKNISIKIPKVENVGRG